MREANTLLQSNLFFKSIAVIILAWLSTSLFGQTNVSGNQSGTWTLAGSPYILTSSVSVLTGQTLTIQSGVEIRSNHYTDQFTVFGTLKAQGTLSDSIRFKGFANSSVSPNSTHGGRIYFESTSVNSTMEYVVIDRWGDVDIYGGDQGAIRIASGSLSISKSNIRNSEKTGIYIIASSLSPTISNLVFENNEKPIQAYPSNVGGISDCPNISIDIMDGNTGSTTLIPKIGFNSYYQLNGGFRIPENSITTIQPGVEIRSRNYYDRINVDGTLIAKGHPLDSVRFIGYPNPALNINSTHGGTLQFNSMSKNSIIDYSVFDKWGETYANSYPGAINIYSPSLDISNCAIRNTKDKGITIFPMPVLKFPRIAHVLFFNNPKAISAHPSGVGGISDCINTAIYLNNTTTSDGSVISKPGPGSYYVLDGGFNIPSNTTMKIQPGVEIRSMSYNDQIIVNGTLIAKGTMSDSIRFTGFANSSLNVNSTHGGRIYFQGASTSTRSQLEYVVVDRWGDADIYNGDKGALSIYSGSLSISKSCIRNSEKTGIYILTGYITPIISDIIVQNTEKAIITYPSSTGGISNCPNTVIHLSSGYMGNTGTAFTMPWPGFNSYYQLNGGFDVPASVTATIQPGVEIRSNNYQDAITVNGTLKAKGTVTDSIRFKGFANPSLNPNSTHGGHIYFQSTSLIANSELEYVAIDRWGDINIFGGDKGAVNVTSSALSISKSTIRNSERTGISFSSLTAVPQITQNNFSENPIDITANPVNCSGIHNNNNTKITIASGWIDRNSTWPYPGTNSFYILTERVFVNPNYSLTVEAGSLVDFGEKGAIEVDGTLRAVGTQTAPVQFVRLQNSSDYYATGRVYLKNTSSNSVLNYVNFDKLGAFGWSQYASLQIETTSFSIENITISNSYYSGLYYSAAGSPIIKNSSFINNKMGIHIGAQNNTGKLTLSNCNIYANVNFGINNESYNIADTVDARNCYWGTPTGPYHATLNPSGLGNKVSNKVKFNPWNTQPLNGQNIDIGVSTLLSPFTDCNHTSADSIKVRIKNYGNVPQSGFAVSYKINNLATVTENVGLSLLPGSYTDYTFTQKSNFSAVGSYTVKVYTTLSSDSLKANDTLNTSIENLPAIVAATNLSPLNNIINLDVPLTLSWSAVSNATAYDLYVWKGTDAIPTVPFISNLSQITYTLNSNVLQFGTTYKWKVITKRNTCRSESAIQSFTIRSLPDLIVDSVIVPPTATSETDIAISWKVKNQGTGSTVNGTWRDFVYLCDQTTFSFFGNKYYILGTKPNVSALAPGQSYRSDTTFRLPQGIQGPYYVFVKSEPDPPLKEVTQDNNQTMSSPLNISLAPPPDLQVTNLIVNPLTAFSNDSINVVATITNTGTGPTTTDSWTDMIFLSKNKVFDLTNAVPLFSKQHQGVLLKDSTYTLSKKLHLPQEFTGVSFIHVVTDRYFNVFEYIRETNNTTTSDTLNIIASPTPNLIVTKPVLSADSIANNQTINIQWTTKNEGGLRANPFWAERIYLSTDTFFNVYTDKIIATYRRSDTLKSLAANTIQLPVQLPYNVAEGKYYAFIKTDADSTVFERNFENDNVSPYSNPVIVTNPDLKPIDITVPANILSEQQINVSWNVKNDSRGGIYNSTWIDKFYLSADNILDTTVDVLLSSITLNQLLPPASEYVKNTTLTMPTGMSGSLYLILASDRHNTVYEKTESNNILVKPVTIGLSPWPDLQVTTVTSPAIDTAGTTLNIQYVASNTGNGSVNNKTWKDFVYLSPSTNVNNPAIILIDSINQSRTLATGESYNQYAAVNIPSTVTGGAYYVVVSADATNKIFENTGESNNRTVGSLITIANIPPIDLSAIGGQIISPAVTAGQPVTLQWTVKNNSTVASVASPWDDAIYLSSNPVLDASDILLGIFPKAGSIPANSTYMQTQTVTIPNDASGTLYLLVNTDKNNKQNDPNRNNNTLALNNGQGVSITVLPPADLVPVSLTVPEQGITSQPITISYKIKNNGVGATLVPSWKDNLYLSTDNILDVADVRIASFARSTTLGAGAVYTDSQQVVLPSYYSGNYILILKTDADNQVYERDMENNNTALSNIYIKLQLPSDLLVTEVTVPLASQVAGTNSTIKWKINNAGANTALGFMREAVYLSTDTTYDINDILFGTLQSNLNLPSFAPESHELTMPVANVTPGNYFALVRTDIQNTIVEQNDSNNIKASATPMNVTVKELYLNIAAADTLINEVPLYYKIFMSAALQSETFAVTLKGDSAKNAVNRLFVSYEKIPSANVYDYAAKVPFKANQEAVIPELKQGRYYITGLGIDTFRAKQPVSLLAKIIPFSIATIETNKGGNTGSVTVKISGARFEPSTIFKLSGPSEISASNVLFLSSTAVYATFNLSGQPLGVYTVKAINNTNIAQLNNGFQVVAGSPGGTGLTGTGFTCTIQNTGFENNLYVGAQYPSVAVTGRSAIITIGFENTGNVDIPVQFRRFVSPEGVFMNFSPEYSGQLTDLPIEFKEEGGPPGIIRPGATGFIKVYAMIQGTPGVLLHFFLIE